MFNNTVASTFPMDIQSLIYSAMNNGIPVYYTMNRRGVPGDSFISEVDGRYVEVVINPSKQQMEYLDYQLYPIEVAVEKLMDMDRLTAYYFNMPKVKFEKAIGSILHKILHQYTSADITEYMRSITGVQIH